MIVTALFVLTMMAIGARGYRRGSVVARRKMRWRLYGAVIGMVPVLLAAGAAFAAPERFHWVLSACVALVALPIALTIAILRHNVLDIDHLISATAAGSILLIVTVTAALTFVPHAAEALSGAIGMNQTVGQMTLSSVVAALLIPVHRRLRLQIDRVFFAQRYAVEQGMQALLVELSADSEPESVLPLAARRLNDLLHPQSLALYLARGDLFEPSFWCGKGKPIPLEASGPLVAALRQRSRPLSTDTGAAPWMDAARDPFDRAAMEKLQASVVVPIRMGDQLAAFLSLDAKRSRDVYTPTEVSWLAAVAEKVSGELLRRDYDRRIEHERAMRSSLRRYVPEAVAAELDSGAELATSERDVCVMFIDLRGYTAVSEGKSTDEIFGMINRYTEVASEIIRRYGGTIVEFAGDGMMAVFGAPQALSGKERAAVEAGYELLGAVALLAPVGGTPLRAGVGIATGPAFVGNVRSSDRLIWTVIGNTPNLASRLQALTRDLEVDIAIDTSTWKAAGVAAAGFRCHRATPIRGRTSPEDVYVLSTERKSPA